MTLYRHCDNPDCNTHERKGTLDRSGWIYLNPQSGGTYHLCSWRCVQVYATSKLPKVRV